MSPNTPICPQCGTKFPGDPCKKCGKDKQTATVEKATRMPHATRRRKRHGRQNLA